MAHTPLVCNAEFQPVGVDVDEIGCSIERGSFLMTAIERLFIFIFVYSLYMTFLYKKKTT